MALTTQPPDDENEFSTPIPILLQLPRPLFDYRIIIAVLKGDVGAINILKDALNISKALKLPNPLLLLGPTTPLSLNPPPAAKILWATFTDNSATPNNQRCTVIQPDQLTDLSLNLEKLSKTRNGHIPLIIGDFLDNVLSVSTAPAGLYLFLCKLFTRIRTNEQTAFLVATDDLHDAKKTAVLKRFADLIIEYNSVEDMAGHRIEARILDHLENQCTYWGETPKPTINGHTSYDQWTPGFGRQYDPSIQGPIRVPARPS